MSPDIADGLRQAGHDAVHVRDYGLQTAEDSTVLARARTEGRLARSPSCWQILTLLRSNRIAGP
ncbi:MAG: DUF5615 family PIN-like protein [Xanthobacteraceae bacterium]|nr:DUF5615 family PIN-like protein [Xanthobacteraceae bacterium]